MTNRQTEYMRLTDKQITTAQDILIRGNQVFDVEITSRCNKLCPICPRHNFKREQKDMDDELFYRLINWIPSGATIMFAGFGEPLLHKSVLQYIRKATDLNLGTTLYTNGILLTENIVAQLIDCGLNKLQISILPEESDKMHYFAQQYAKYSSKIRFNALFNGEDYYDNVEQIKAMGYAVFPKKVHNRGGALTDYVNETEVESCGTFFRATYIDVDGNIQICSNDINGSNNLGNIANTSWNDVVNIKLNHLGNQPITGICKHCSDEFRLIHLKRALGLCGER